MSHAKNASSDRSSRGINFPNHLQLGLIGLGVIFASLGLGEAVYRFAFLDFDGANDRLPLEMLFGLAFAWIAVRSRRRIYQCRIETSAGITLIRERSSKIRCAVDAIPPVPYPIHQQAIRVIREEVDRIDWVLTDLIPKVEEYK